MSMPSTSLTDQAIHRRIAARFVAPVAQSAVTPMLAPIVLLTTAHIASNATSTTRSNVIWTFARRSK